MAIYCWRCGVITRSKTVDGREVGSSAVAASAYRSGREMYDERRQEREDYSRRHGVVRDVGEVLLPDNAPDEYLDREVLWNAVEAVERAHNAQLAREIVIAMPVELLDADRTYDAIAQLGHDYSQMLADQGMCVQWDLHDPDNEDRNPHIHILATMRAIDEDGAWLPKTHKEYLLRDPSGELDDRYANSQERTHLRDEGWQDVYSYRDRGSRLRLTADEAAERGLTNADRADRHPISRKCDTTDWNTPERFEQWRRSWEDMCNERLREIGREDQEISRLSYQERGIDRVPTIHEGSWVCEREREAMAEAEAEGRDYVPVTDIRAANIIIAETNEQIAELERDPIPAMERELAPDEQERDPESWQQRAMVRELLDHGWQARTEMLHPREVTLEERDDGQAEREAALEQHRTIIEELRDRIERARELARAAVERVREMLRELPEQVREAVRTVEDLVREHEAQRAVVEHEREEPDRPIAMDRGDGDGDGQVEERAEIFRTYERAVDALDAAQERFSAADEELRGAWDAEREYGEEHFDQWSGLDDLEKEIELEREIAAIYERGVSERERDLSALRLHPLRNLSKIREQSKELQQYRDEVEKGQERCRALQERADQMRVVRRGYDALRERSAEAYREQVRAKEDLEQARERVYEVCYDRMTPQERAQAREEIYDPGREPIERVEARQQALQEQRERELAERRIERIVRVCWHCRERDLTPEQERSVERVISKMDEWEMDEVRSRAGYVPDAIEELYERSHTGWEQDDQEWEWRREDY